MRKSTRAKRLMIKVYPGGRVEVVVPRRTRAADVQAFVRDNAAWIRDARESYAADYPSEAFALPDTIRLPAVERQLSVHYRSRPGAASVRYSLSGTRLVLTGKTGDEQLCIRALRRCLAAVARKEFTPRLRSLSLFMNTPYKKIQIRAQRTCWGSRSSSGTVSLNVCLLFLQPSIARYLLIHELCHGRHMNHSKRFWKFVGKFEPDYRRLDRDLTESWRQVPPWMGVH
ncbi:MAG: SprT family zinc-dependent metalloprotease [Woeseia sp.]